jgi:predicted transcriptional regulator
MRKTIYMIILMIPLASFATNNPKELREKVLSNERAIKQLESFLFEKDYSDIKNRDEVIANVSKTFTELGYKFEEFYILRELANNQGLNEKALIIAGIARQCLRDLREELERVPKYKSFSVSTLSSSEVLEISGFGDAKYSKYGIIVNKATVYFTASSTVRGCVDFYTETYFGQNL